MYNIRASLQKYKIKKIHQKSPDRETVFNYHLNSGLTFNNHGFDTGKYDDPSVVAILTDSPNPSNYWKVLKHRLRKEGNESVTNCNQLKMLSSDGKYYKTDVATTEQLFQLIRARKRGKKTFKNERDGMFYQSFSRIFLTSRFTSSCMLDRSLLYTGVFR